MKTDKVHFSLVFLQKKIFFSHKNKVDGLKKFLKSKWCWFFYSMHFKPYPTPSGLEERVCSCSSIFKLYWVLEGGVKGLVGFLR